MAYSTISQNALLVGFCPLIPLPFVDDLARKIMMRGAYMSIAEQVGKPLDSDTARVLTKDDSSLLLGCLVAVVWWPIRKFLRTVFYFLTVKQCIDWAGEAAIRGAMVQHALERGLLPDKAEEVRQAMDLAWKRHGGSPVVGMWRQRHAGELGWASEPGLTQVGGGVARLGGGNDVLAQFSAMLDAVQRGLPLLSVAADLATDGMADATPDVTPDVPAEQA